MEKLIYLLQKPASTGNENFTAFCTGDAVNAIQATGGSRIVVNVADLTERITTEAPTRLIGPTDTLGAAIEFWIDCLDERAPIEALLQQHCESLAGYLVTESVPQACEHPWAEGERRPGVTQYGANGKPPQVSDEHFYHHWQQVHSPSSFDLHPLRWSYVRNAVARALTPNAPAYRAIVLEHFQTLEDFTDDSRYFGSDEAVQNMMAEVAEFVDFDCMVSVPMSEYHFS